MHRAPRDMSLSKAQEMMWSQKVRFGISKLECRAESMNWKILISILIFLLLTELLPPSFSLASIACLTR